jgi:16S rRNA (guanine(966)-N(2))-methyltransferase RsmD
MRIIAGAKRGMKLLSPETNVSRPITDRVKESLFSVLYKYDLPAVQQAHRLVRQAHHPEQSRRAERSRRNGKIAADLFCGVGSLGLEALSRGAEFVTFVEKNPKIIATLKKNIEKAGFAGESKVIRADAFKIGAPVDVQKYDLIFVDPPYAVSRESETDSPLGKLLVLLTEQLSPAGIVVVRTEKRIELLEQYGRLKVIERRQWGTMVITILHRSNE